MNPAEMRDLIQQYIDAYNCFDVEGMLATVHPEVEFRNVSKGEVTAAAMGIDALRSLAEESKMLFSEREQTVSAFDSGDDCANASVGFRAMLACDLPNGMKKGQELRLTGRSEFRFRDGMIFQITDIS
jgi:ketosteroid isomerase-like protein